VRSEYWQRDSQEKAKEIEALQALLNEQIDGELSGGEEPLATEAEPTPPQQPTAQVTAQTGTPQVAFSTDPNVYWNQPALKPYQELFSRKLNAGMSAEDAQSAVLGTMGLRQPDLFAVVSAHLRGEQPRQAAPAAQPPAPTAPRQRPARPGDRPMTVREYEVAQRTERRQQAALTAAAGMLDRRYTPEFMSEPITINNRPISRRDAVTNLMRETGVYDHEAALSIVDRAGRDHRVFTMRLAEMQRTNREVQNAAQLSPGGRAIPVNPMQPRSMPVDDMLARAGLQVGAPKP
jgi:hypothetical protein